MSHWRTGKLDFSCTIGALRAALINILPEWEQHIQIDPNGSLSVADMDGVTQSGFHVKINNGAPGVRYCDLGFKQNGDGTWSAQIDDMGLPRELKGPAGLEKKVQSRVSEVKLIASAEEEGWPISGVDRHQNKNEMYVDIPVGDEYKIHA